MSSARRIALVSGLIGAGVLLGCSSEPPPPVLQVSIVSDRELDVLVYCSDTPQPPMVVSESDTEVRLTVTNAAPQHECITPLNVTLEAALGTRAIVDGHDSTTVAVHLDFRCGDPVAPFGRCDDIYTPRPREI